MMGLLSRRKYVTPVIILPGRFFYVGTAAGTIYYSDDAHTLVTTTPAALSGLNLRNIEATGDNVVVSTNTGRIFYSYDRGVTFTESASGPISNLGRITRVGPGEFVAWAVGATVYSLSSTDGGATWTTGGSMGANTMVPNDITGGIMNGDHCTLFVAGNAAGGIYTSTDLGATWTRSSTADTTACTFNGDRFFVAKTRIYDSTDFATWNLKAGLIGGATCGGLAMEATWGLAATTSGVIYRITNNGDVTSLISSATTTYHAAEVYDTMAYVGPGDSGSTHKYSIDSGATFSAFTNIGTGDSTVSRYDL